MQRPENIESFIQPEKQQFIASEAIKLAHPGLRLINFVIDSFIWFIMAAVSVVVLDSAFPTMSHFGINALAYISMAALFLGYYIFMEFYFQKTLGKIITGTKVIDMDGGKPKAKAILFRSIIRMMPVEWLSYLFMRNGGHDFLSKTCVVRSTKIKLAN